MGNTPDGIDHELRELPVNFLLAHGGHGSVDEGLCLMEAVAFVAGEPHSDHPACACPLLAAYGRRLNDRFDDDERQLLAPLIPLLVGTRADFATKQRRAYVLADAAIREIVPLGLERVGWKDLADRLRALAPVVDVSTARASHAAASAVRALSWERRKAAADAAYDAAAAYAADARQKLRKEARRPIVEVGS